MHEAAALGGELGKVGQEATLQRLTGVLARFALARLDLTSTRVLRRALVVIVLVIIVAHVSHAASHEGEKLWGTNEGRPRGIKPRGIIGRCDSNAICPLIGPLTRWIAPDASRSIMEKKPWTPPDDGPGEGSGEPTRKAAQLGARSSADRCRHAESAHLSRRMS